MFSYYEYNNQRIIKNHYYQDLRAEKLRGFRCINIKHDNLQPQMVKKTCRHFFTFFDIISKNIAPYKSPLIDLD